MHASQIDTRPTTRRKLNKQSFFLTVIESIYRRKPFASETGIASVSSIAKSASKILSQQLNNLAGDLIEGVELI
jgi:hypothetical protein